MRSHGTGFVLLNFPDQKFGLIGERNPRKISHLRRAEKASNDAFRKAVTTVVHSQPWASEITGAAGFETDGSLVSNDWANGHQDYERIIRGMDEAGVPGSGAGRSDLYGRVIDELYPKAYAVFKEFSEREGWGYPGPTPAELKAGPRFSLSFKPADGAERTGFEPTATTRAFRGVRRAPPAVGKGQSAETNIARDRAARERANVTDGTELEGDGLRFEAFFETVANGANPAYIPVRPYKPAIPLGKSAQAFKEERNKHRGNFDDHIAASIPGFDEVQAIVGDAILGAYPNGATVLDIGASEGAFIKALGVLSKGKITSDAIDPNPAMAQKFSEISQVPGTAYYPDAFSSAEKAGKYAWTDKNGKDIYFFNPKGKTYDVVHEAMVFQFIDNGRNAQVTRVKELMKPDGIAIFEEKYGDLKARYDNNEAKKDREWKLNFFTLEQIEQKRRDVLQTGEDAVEGMTDLQVAWWEMEDVLKKHFKHVAQFWDSGNFRGYVGSDSNEALENFISNMQSTDTKFANENTPARVTDAPSGGNLRAEDGRNTVRFNGEVRAIPQYGDTQEGAVSLRGVHYSREPRESLSSKYYGTGMRGAEAVRLAAAVNKELRQRIHFYIDEGAGIRPESSVGYNRPTVQLNNLNDIQADPRGLKAKPDANEPVTFNGIEAAVMAATDRKSKPPYG